MQAASSGTSTWTTMRAGGFKRRRAAFNEWGDLASPFASAALAVSLFLTALAARAAEESAPSLASPSSAVSRTTNGIISAQETARARRLYSAKCAKCHKFYDPAAYSEADWRQWMVKMGKKSKLKPDQEDLLSRYLATFRAPARSRDGGLTNSE